LSPDPALPQYLPEMQSNGRLLGMGGVFSPVNMQLYHYAANNPVKYVDPDGQVVYEYDSNTGQYQWTIEDEDTVDSIATETGFSPTALQKANPNLDIGVGAIITIPQTRRIRAFQWATQQIGSRAYAPEATIDNFPAGSYKCNKFVGDAYEKGAGVHDYPRTLPLLRMMGKGYPAPVTRDWLLTDDDRLGSLRKVTEPRIGDLAAFPGGHVTMIGLKGTLIGAGGDEGTICLRTLAFLQTHGFPDPPIFWRYSPNKLYDYFDGLGVNTLIP